MIIDKKYILGIGFSNVNLEEVLEFITKGLEKSQVKYYIVTPNPEILMIARKNNTYKKVLNDAFLALADSVGIILASKFEGKSLKERIAGVDLMERVCERVSKEPITVGFLGGGHFVAEKTAECLKTKYSGLKVAFAIEEWPKNNSELKAQSSKLACDILFVAFGSPKQEIWIAQNLKKLPIKVAMGVGGAFDFISGKVPRAPKYIRMIGFEWLFRLIIQPWRIKRQLAIPVFIALIFKEVIAIRLNKLAKTNFVI